VVNHAPILESLQDGVSYLFSTWQKAPVLFGGEF